jgi:hypothetical protein
VQGKCRKCKKPVPGHFDAGKFIFQHCGVRWTTQAKNHGKQVVSKSGSKIGTVAGAVAGIIHGDIGGGLIGAKLGKIIGAAFDRDNGIDCPKCSVSRAFPTGIRKSEKRQYQCRLPRCMQYTYR